MKPAPFNYIRATSLSHALSALTEAGEDAMILAGGQTLVPMMAMRLARPACLIDLNEIADLSGIEHRDGYVRIGAMTRQAAALADAEVRTHAPLLAKALSFVGHTQTRNRGTVGGSVAHGDPSAEIPLAAIALDAEIDLASGSGVRTIKARDFYTGPLSSVRQADEILNEIRFPVWSATASTGFQEVSPRHGDFALVAVAVQIDRAQDGTCTRASVALGGASPNPVRAPELEAALVGRRIDAALAHEVSRAVDSVLSPTDDLHASAAYRRRVARVLSERAILEAAA